MKHQRRRDDKYPVSVCVTHSRSKAYIKTGYYVDRSKLSRSFELRDNLILSELFRRIEEFERKFVSLGKRAGNFTARELADIVSAKNEMNFTDFFEDYIANLKLSKKTVQLYGLCLGHLKKFKEVVFLSDIDNAFLCAFLDYLQSSGVGKRGQQYYFVLLKAVFRAAVKKYRRDTGDIMDDVFEDFKIPENPVPKKRNLSAETIRKLATWDELAKDRKVRSNEFLAKYEFARDVFMISFLLCGTNTVDIYNMEKEKNGRLSYNRSKTTGRRKDGAFISYKIEPELRMLMEKYAGKERAFDFCERYKSANNFNWRVNDFLKFFVEPLGLPADFSTYYARHSWATIARNRCEVSKDDISAALNHVSVSIFDRKMVADDYIELDYSVIDAANRKVIDFVFSL